MRDVLCIKSDVKRAKSASRSNHRARTGELQLRRNIFWKNLPLEKMHYLNNFFYKLDMFSVHQFHKMFSRSGTASYAGRGGEDYGPHVSSCHEPHQVREHLDKKNMFSFGHCLERGGPLPEFFWHFFTKFIFGLFIQNCKLNSELDEISKLPV